MHCCAEAGFGAGSLSLMALLTWRQSSSLLPRLPGMHDTGATQTLCCATSSVLTSYTRFFCHAAHSHLCRWQCLLSLMSALLGLSPFMETCINGIYILYTYIVYHVYRHSMHIA